MNKSIIWLLFLAIICLASVNAAVERRRNFGYIDLLNDFFGHESTDDDDGDDKTYNSHGSSFACPHKCKQYYDGCNVHNCHNDGRAYYKECANHAKCDKKKYWTKCMRYENEEEESNEHKICPQGCAVWFDGCNLCECYYQGKIGKSYAKCSQYKTKGYHAQCFEWEDSSSSSSSEERK
eukprot:TRINITY_DN2906_c0_g1_i1.p1 TRINITY_DN2906_c0_g1~~TRINITY_DN2906_c0_g1_i1.p1  ORF type:complete len:179 (-),score=48.43 TRINITY_DN2906_c0_g1_i1:218-754(-)